ncbi:type II toxin-antitoxin system VapC family toxin [Fibrobacterota bacterium]
MNIVDTSGWLEYFAGSSRVKYYEKAVEKTSELLVPAVCVYEVFKKLLTDYGEDEALTAIGHMKTGKVIDIDFGISVQAAKISKEHKIPMADSIILACGIKHNAVIYTQDSDFKKMPNVKYFEKRKSA